MNRSANATKHKSFTFRENGYKILVMIPSAENSDYPIFVPDQVLTSDNLNDLFEYLDEQERMTRTNLTGVGIVCGLHPVAAADGSGITVSKGVAVTTNGYMVALQELIYTRRSESVFDAVKCVYYDRFVDISQKKQRFDMWELKQAAETTGTTPLNAAFIENKVVVLFVELLETNNKNCDPDSCDDKGARVTVQVRPLLVSKTDVDTFLSNTSNTSTTGTALLLPEAKMPRFDVPATLLLDSQDLFSAYRHVLSQSFISGVFALLSKAYAALQPMLKDNYPVDPFAGQDARFSFLYGNSINYEQVLTLQYYYDFFADLLMGYEELRTKTAHEVYACLPDDSLFPRHVLAGEAKGFDARTSLYRTRFISSPVLRCGAESTAAVNLLFNRLVLMLQNLAVQVIPADPSNKRKLTPVNITPSSHGAVPLSDKAIPFYYKVNDGADPLYLNWNRKRTANNTATGILSYKAGDYNSTDDFVLEPLHYDLEPYNFLRVEGHIGHDYRKVLSDLDQLKKTGRLPVDVIALSSDTRGIFSITDAIDQMDTTGSVTAAFEIMLQHRCCFADIFLALDEWINKLRCCLADQMRFYLQLPSFTAAAQPLREKKFFSRTIPEKNNFEIRENTIGHLYREKLDAGTINNQFCSEVFVHIATGKAEAGSALVMMPYKIDQFAEVLPEHITDLDAKALEARYADLTATAQQMRNMYASPNVAGTLTSVDLPKLTSTLEMNCLVCLFMEFRLLVRAFMIRLLGIMLRHKLGYYAVQHPGIQHKAGVPVGGTLILVYHEATVRRLQDGKTDFTTGFKRVQSKSGMTMNTLVSGEQPLLSSMLLQEEMLFLQQVKLRPDLADFVLDPIIRNIPAGTVIADFFVPYLCCSDCPPTQMVVLTEPETPNQAPVAHATATPETLSLRPGATGTAQLDSAGSADPEGAALSFLWSLPAGTTGAEIDQPEAAVTTATFTQPGSYTFTLTVKDDKGLTGTTTATVKVQQEIIEKTCASLLGIIELFNGLRGVDTADNFKSFTASYQPFKDIQAFYRLMEAADIADKPVADQVAFFKEQEIAKRLPEWIGELLKIIRGEERLRLLALTMLQVHAQLAYYIACIQAEDVQDAEVRMADALKALIELLGQIVPDVPNYPAEQRIILERLLSITTKEKDRLVDNGEDNTKPLYSDFLRKIEIVLQSMNL